MYCMQVTHGNVQRTYPWHGKARLCRELFRAVIMLQCCELDAATDRLAQGGGAQSDGLSSPLADEVPDALRQQSGGSVPPT